MAYPAFFVSPFQYRMNWHSQDTRNHLAPNSQRFVADTDVHAAAAAALLGGYVSAQNTSLSKRMGVHNPNVVHPTGTRLSANILVLNAVYGTQRYHLRNLKTTLVNPEAALTALFLGTANVPDNVAALSAAPSQPDGGPAITVVNIAVINKH